MEQKAKLEEEKKAKAEAEAAEKVARLPIEIEAGVFADPDTKMYTINITKKNKTGMKAYKGQVRGWAGKKHDSARECELVNYCHQYTFL